MEGEGSSGQFSGGIFRGTIFLRNNILGAIFLGGREFLGGNFPGRFLGGNLPVLVAVNYH